MLNEPISIVRLFVLGLLDESDRHGYEIVAVADRWSIYRWSGISIGSIYHAIRKIVKEEMVSIAKIERDGNRPERQVYTITNRGRDEFQRLAQAGLGSLEYEAREVDMALAFAHRVDPIVRKQRLQDRLGPLTERLTQLEELANAYDICLDNPSAELDSFRYLRKNSPWIQSGVQHGLARLIVERDWTIKLIAEIDNWPIAAYPSSIQKS